MTTALAIPRTSEPLTSAAPDALVDFEVCVRLLQGPQGTLLVESPAEIAAKYADMEDDAHVRYAAEDPSALKNQLARLAAAKKQETTLFKQLEKQRGEEVAGFTFQFRTATIADHEAAEAEASRAGLRQELVYRRALAQNTFAGTDLPDFKDFLSLRTDIALHVLRQVAGRVTLTQDVRAFLLG